MGFVLCVGWFMVVCFLFLFMVFFGGFFLELCFFGLCCFVCVFLVWFLGFFCFVVLCVWCGVVFFLCVLWFVCLFFCFVLIFVVFLVGLFFGFDCCLKLPTPLYCGVCWVSYLLFYCCGQIDVEVFLKILSGLNFRGDLACL